MSRFPNPIRARGVRPGAAIIATAVSVLAVALVGVALAKTFVLQAAHGAKVSPQSGATRTETIAVSVRGFAVYMLSGDSRSHPECTSRSGCFSVWPPLTVSSGAKLSAGPGVTGKLGVWHRDGFSQVTLGGHPLYRFSGDTRRHSATGEGLQSFGGTWHVVKAR